MGNKIEKVTLSSRKPILKGEKVWKEEIVHRDLRHQHYMVWNKEKNAPVRTYWTLSDAWRTATIFAMKYPGQRFRVMQTVFDVMLDVQDGKEDTFCFRMYQLVKSDDQYIDVGVKHGDG